jgi:hypothetical protein
MRRVLASLMFLAAGAAQAWAYYHFVRYVGPAGFTQTVSEKFDLAALPNGTVSFLVAENSAALLSDPGAFPAVLNLVREACQTWNAVPTSQLRVTFGGLFRPGSPQTTPGAEIYFEELDPLTLGVGGPTSRGTPVAGPGGLFVPITRSVVRLNQNLSLWSGPSFAEAFYLTVTHELGHALGLQHTFTAATMSTEVTRATSLGRPLDDDDIAGISALYPVAGFAEKTGTITGRVVYEDGAPVHLASVVAIRPSGSAVSVLTDWEGRYRIEGVPPGTYQIYVHPLPSSGRANAGLGDIVLPRDGQDRQIEASSPFDTVFFQGNQTTRDHRLASFFLVTPGKAVDLETVRVRRRSAYRFSPLTTYSFFGQTAVRPAIVNAAEASVRTVVAFSRGLAANNVPAAGLQLEFLGGTPLIAPNGVRAYNGEWLAVDLQPTSLLGASGVRHLVVSLGDDIYVRPNAVRLVSSDPPLIETLTGHADGSVTVRGRNLGASTRFLFDGVRSTILSVDAETGIRLAPPPGIRGRQVALTGVNPDGQNSAFLRSAQAGAVHSFTYDSGETGILQAVTPAIAAGAESMVEVTGIGVQFDPAVTTIGFGSSDLQVRRFWVTEPNRLLANVWVAPEAALGPVTLTAVNGFRVLSQPAAVVIRPADPLAITVSSMVVNAVPGQSGVFPGALVAVSGANLTDAAVSIGGQPAEVVSAETRRLVVRVPLSLPTGPALLRVSSAQSSATVVVGIEPTPPEIAGVGGAGAEAVRAFRAGDSVVVEARGLVEPSGPVALARLRVICGGVEHPVIELTPVAGAPGVARVHFVLSALVPAGAQVPLTIAVDGRTSQPALITVLD